MNIICVHHFRPPLSLKAWSLEEMAQQLADCTVLAKNRRSVPRTRVGQHTAWCLVMLGNRIHRMCSLWESELYFTHSLISRATADLSPFSSPLLLPAHKTRVFALPYEPALPQATTNQNNPPLVVG